MLSRELIAASSAPLVLAILSEEPNYGYAILKKVKELSDEKISWTDAMLYPVLHRLEKQKLLVGKWQAVDRGPRRRYYSITSKGRRALTSHQEQWSIMHASLTNAWKLI
jgi:PadR family transcriptional regulator, regulatory protein PadR